MDGSSGGTTENANEAGAPTLPPLDIQQAGGTTSTAVAPQATQPGGGANQPQQHIQQANPGAGGTLPMPSVRLHPSTLPLHIQAMTFRQAMNLSSTPQSDNLMLNQGRIQVDTPINAVGNLAVFGFAKALVDLSRAESKEAEVQVGQTRNAKQAGITFAPAPKRQRGMPMFGGGAKPTSQPGVAPLVANVQYPFGAQSGFAGGVPVQQPFGPLTNQQVGQHQVHFAPMPQQQQIPYQPAAAHQPFPQPSFVGNYATVGGVQQQSTQQQMPWVSNQQSQPSFNAGQGFAAPQSTQQTSAMLPPMGSFQQGVAPPQPQQQQQQQFLPQTNQQSNLVTRLQGQLQQNHPLTNHTSMMGYIPPGGDTAQHQMLTAFTEARQRQALALDSTLSSEAQQPAASAPGQGAPARPANTQTALEKVRALIFQGRPFQLQAVIAVAAQGLRVLSGKDISKIFGGVGVEEAVAALNFPLLLGVGVAKWMFWRTHALQREELRTQLSATDRALRIAELQSVAEFGVTLQRYVESYTIESILAFANRAIDHVYNGQGNFSTLPATLIMGTLIPLPSPVRFVARRSTTSGSAPKTNKSTKPKPGAAKPPRYFGACFAFNDGSCSDAVTNGSKCSAGYAHVCSSCGASDHVRSRCTKK